MLQQDSWERCGFLRLGHRNINLGSQHLQLVVCIETLIHPTLEPLYLKWTLAAGNGSLGIFTTRSKCHTASAQQASCPSKHGLLMIIVYYYYLLLCRLLQWMDNSECSKPIELARVVLPAVHAHIKFRAERWVPDDFGIVDFHELRCGRRTF